jgi:hypothetical protein
MASTIGSVYNPSFGDLQNTADAVNRINLGATKTAQGARIPNATGLESQSSKDIAAQLRGEVPSDVLALLGQQGAEGAVGSGSSSQAAYLKALGLTSIGQMKTGQENLTSALARNPAAPIFDVGSQIVTPYQQANLDLSQQAQDLAKQKETVAEQIALQQAALQNEQSKKNLLSGQIIQGGLGDQSFVGGGSSNYSSGSDQPGWWNNWGLPPSTISTGTYADTWKTG